MTGFEPAIQPRGRLGEADVLPDDELMQEVQPKNGKSLVQHSRPGYKCTPVGWIPEEWEVKRLNQVAEVKGGFAFDSSKFQGEGAYQVIKMSNLYEGILDLTRSQSFLNNLTPQEAEFILKSGDIIITLTGTVGKRDYGYSFLVTSESNLLLNQRVAKVSADPEVADPTFLSYELKTNRFLNPLFYSSRGGTGNQANVGKTDLANISVALPPLPEQRAIAALLSTWDKAIDKTIQLITQKEFRKKWLMQQLLTGKKRLPGFEGEWKEVRLGDYFKFVKSYSISRDGLTDESSEEPIYCIHYGDIHAFYDNEFLDFSIQKRIPVIKSESCVIDKKNLLKEGDIILADASEDYEGVGEAVEVINLKNKLAVGGLHTSSGWFAYYHNPRWKRYYLQSV